MARDHVPRGQGGRLASSPGKVEWPMTRADNGETVYVTNKRVTPRGTILVDDSDTGETYRCGPPLRLGQVEPYEA